MPLAMKPFPGFSAIYELSCPDASGAFVADIELDDGFEVLSGEVKPLAPVRARWAGGSKMPGLIVWTTHAAPMLMSQQVVSVLRDSGFQGWSTYDVDLSGHDDTQLRGYCGLSVHGRCGPIDVTKAAQLPRIHAGAVSPSWMGLYFDPDTWDGSDIFMPEGTGGWVLVVETVKQALMRAGVANVRLAPLPEVELYGQFETDPLQRAMFRVWGRIDDQMREVGFDGARHPVRVLSVIGTLMAEVSNGGFEQYMFNPSGDRAGHITDALREVGAAELASICERFFALLPEGHPAEDVDARQSQLDAAAAAMGEEAFDQACGELAEQVYSSSEVLDRRLLAYARRNSL